MSHVIDKAKDIRLLILDIDGVLTNGIIYYQSQNTDIKGFHIQDGLGLKLLMMTGVNVAIISGKKSGASAQRLSDLKIQHAYLGYDDKIPPYNELKQKLNLEDKQIAYMGDDLPDLPILRRAGLAITVPAAPAIVRQHVDLITNRAGGEGAVREACEFIMEAQGKYQTVIQSYLKQ